MIFLVIALPGLGFGYTGTHTYPFTNNLHKKHATDIHIQFSHAVYWDKNDMNYTWQFPLKTFTDCNYHEGNLNVVDFVQGPEGKGVPDGKTVELTLNYWGDPPTVVDWNFTFPIPSDIPTVSEWGLIIMAGLLLTVGAVVIRRRFKTVPA